MCVCVYIYRNRKSKSKAINLVGFKEKKNHILSQTICLMTSANFFIAEIFSLKSVGCYGETESQKAIIMFHLSVHF